MRAALKQSNDVRATFTATFERYGTKKNWHGWPEKTLLFKDVSFADGAVATDHIWFCATKGFDTLGELKQGDAIKFDARVSSYQKGYVNSREGLDERTTDYKLNRPTRIEKVARVNVAPLL